ncbi:E4 34K [Canine adenovirus 2]|uniref:Early E4 30 kDa protein n=2 Tax=Canine adenovirus serotype 2 TaxID=10514 RepID=E434_ADECT|nr:E4 34K [Canine adenovirus 2]P87568.1 RecName: Full=Early E4 30 kDa protein [Canine adenovirus 2 strain Toronto A 26-61]AAB38735.1 E4 ORF5; similar to human Ad2 E4 34 kDa protein [Canine adenovirus 2]QJS39040.1 E4 ORF5 [Canine adenovirus 2]UZP80973.1 E4 34K [Canine adenovirus 2]
MEGNCTAETTCHVTAVVRVPKYCNCFALCYEIPILWDDVLHRHEKLLFGGFTCNAGIELIVTKHCCLAEAQTWRVHCHCSNSLSLQCMASKHVVQKVIEDFIKGGAMNKKYMWYREFVNSSRPDEINYVGSIIFRNTHYIYFRLSFFRTVHKACMEAIKRCINPELGVVLKSTYNYWLVLKCKSCSLQNYCSLKNCAVWVRSVIVRVLKEVEKTPVVLHQTTSKAEERRQSALRQAMMHGRCRQIQNLCLVNLNAFLHF